MWWQIFLFVCSSIVSALLAPKPQNAKASSLGDIQVPTAEEGRCITKILGTCKIEGPNCVWSGDLKTKAIKVSAGWFGRSQILGYRYCLGLHLALTVGKIDELVDVLVGGKSLGVNAAYSDAGTVLHVEKGHLFGGDRQEGGVSGDLAIYFGSRTQQGDSYLEGVLGTPVPGYRGVCHAVLRRMYLGTSRYIKYWAFILRATPAPAGLNPIWANINGDANPSYGIAEILTCDVEEGGMGVSASRLDLSSFSAAAQTLYQEGFGISLQMDNEQAAEEYLADICRTINAVLYTDPSTGLWTLRLIRQDYDPATLPEFGPNDLQEDPEIKWPSWPETINKVVLRYISRAEGFTTRTVQDRDSGNRAIQGVDVMTTLDFKMISNETIAQMVVGRERRTCAYPLAALQLVVNRRAWNLRPGSAFKFSYPPMDIQGLICRVANIRYGRLGDGRITVEAAEDVFASIPATYTPPPASQWSDPVVDPQPAQAQILLEAPYWAVGSSRVILAGAARADHTTLGADLWLKETYDYLPGGDLESMTPTAVLTAPYSCKTAAMDYSETLRLSAGPDMDTLADHNTAIDGVNHGQNLAVFESGEIVSWMCMAGDDSTGYWPLGVLRGCLDTVPTDHAAGERIWFLSQGVADVQGASTGSGLPGADGTNGANGTNGQDGAPGADGQDGVGVPAGGATGQTLVKLSATDFDTGWADVSSSGGSGGHVFHPDAPFSSPSALDDNFEQTSLLSKWTKVNFDSTTPAHTWDIATTRIKQLFSQLAGGSAGDTQRAILQSLPSGDFTVWTKLVTDLAANYQSAGLILSSTNTAGSGSQVTGCSEYFSSAQFLAESYTNFNSYGSTLCSFSKTSQMVYLRFRRSGTTYYFGYSYDGEVWVESTMSVGFTPSYVGLTIKNNNSTTAIKTAFKFFRYKPSATAVLGGLV